MAEKWRIFGNFKRKLGKSGKNVCFFMENAEKISSFGKIWGSCKNFPVTFLNNLIDFLSCKLIL